MNFYKKIVIWAARNPFQAKLLIIFSNISLFILAWISAKILMNHGILIGRPFYYTALAIMVLGLIISPSAKRKSEYVYFEGVFRRRYFSTVLINIAFVLAVMSFPTHFKYDRDMFFGSVFAIEKAVNHNSAAIQQEQDILQSSLKTRFFVRANAPKPEGNKPYGLYIFLLIVLELVIILGGGMLVCALVCNDQIIWAVLVGVATVALLFWIMYVIVKLFNLNAEQRKNKQAAETLNG